MTALVIFYSFPAFSAVFSFLIYGERIRKPEAACILVVMLGIGILFDFRLAGSLLGQAIALLGGCFAGLTVTLIRALRQSNGPVVIYLSLHGQLDALHAGGFGGSRSRSGDDVGP